MTSKTYYICHTVMEMFAPGINVEGIQIGGPEAEPVSLPHLCVHPFPLAICFYQVSKYLTKSLMVAKVRLKVGICWNPSLTRKAGMQG